MNTAMKPLLRIGSVIVLGGFLAAIAGCDTSPTGEAARDELHDSVADTLKRMFDEDPGFKTFLDHADGYVVFPSVGKGALIAGGAYGRGEAFEHGTFIGYADISQATIGAQVGGQSYSEVVAFAAPWAMDGLKEGQLAFDAGVSAVALTAGAALAARYEHGVAVFIEPTGGLMVEAAAGGQKFSFEPK